MRVLLLTLLAAAATSASGTCRGAAFEISLLQRRFSRSAANCSAPSVNNWAMLSI
jgi:hypothetical protein